LDIQNHLGNALSDWEMFIKQNCNDNECADIGKQLIKMRAQNVLTAGDASPGCSEPSTPLQVKTGTSDETSTALALTIFGSANADVNGTWRLAQITQDYWQGEIYALRKSENSWFVERRDNAEDYFYRFCSEGRDGTYSRCEVCPFDGTAVLSPAISSAPELADVRAEPQPRGPKSNQVDLTSVIRDYTLEVSPFLQRAKQDHSIDNASISSAVAAANDLGELDRILNLGCSVLFTEEAVRELNFLRALAGKEPFAFESSKYHPCSTDISGEEHKTGMDLV
jgi:hypothetical protein